jgi:hypothetical protein
MAGMAGDSNTAATQTAWNLPGEDGDDLRADMQAARLGQSEPLPPGAFEVVPNIFGLTPEAARKLDQEAMLEAARQRREGLGNLARVTRLLKSRGAERK